MSNTSAAQNHHGENDRRFQEDEGFRRNEALADCEEGTGKAAEHRADGEGRELGVGGVDAERAAGDLVLAQCFPGPADGQPAQAVGDEIGQQRQQQGGNDDESGKPRTGSDDGDDNTGQHFVSF